VKEYRQRCPPVLADVTITMSICDEKDLCDCCPMEEDCNAVYEEAIELEGTWQSATRINAFMGRWTNFKAVVTDMQNKQTKLEARDIKVPVSILANFSGKDRR